MTRSADGPRASEQHAEALLPAAYAELRRRAEDYLRRERADHTLQPTALVHEAYAKLAASVRGEFRDRTHFVASSARAMREILVDHARARHAQKRGGDATQVTLHDAATPAADGVDLLELHDALARLSVLDARKARMVELRFFGGLTIEEIARELGVSHMTVSNDWRMAQAWLSRELGLGK
ncbi:MAG: ECF-type sigma factor [Planctomycetota bacterium]